MDGELDPTLLDLLDIYTLPVCCRLLQNVAEELATEVDREQTHLLLMQTQVDNHGQLLLKELADFKSKLESEKAQRAFTQRCPFCSSTRPPSHYYIAQSPARHKSWMQVPFLAARGCTGIPCRKPGMFSCLFKSAA